MHTPIVSAIVSTYNSERFIRGCLSDLESQTIAKRLEIIVIDSGSEQNEGTIVKEFQQRYDNIIYIRTEERESLYAAWNRGIKAARGKYITNANTDDRHHRKALEILINALENHPECALVYADVAVTKQENANYYFRHIDGYFKNPEFDQRLLFKACYIGPQPLWRKDLHERYGFFDPSLIVAGDYEFWLRIAKCERFIHIPKILGLYLHNPSGLEHGQRSVCREEAEKARMRHWPETWGPLPVSGGNYYVKKPVLLGKLRVKLRNINTLYRIYQKLSKLTHQQYNNHMNKLLKNNDVIKLPRVSVIVPTFNRPQMLLNALNSIAAQTYKNFEIIVVNDGGEDVAEIINQIPCPHITYIRHPENKGMAAARNTGIKFSKGKYISYLDDDDIIYPHHLETLINCLEKSDYKVAYTKVLICYQEKNGNSYKTVKTRIKKNYPYDSDRLLYNDYLLIMSIMHEKSCIIKAGLFDESLRISEDWDFWIRLSRSYDFYHIDNVTCEYNRRNDLSHASYKVLEAQKARLKIFIKYIKYSITKPIVRKEQKEQATRALENIIKEEYHIIYDMYKIARKICKYALCLQRRKI